MKLSQEEAIEKANKLVSELTEHFSEGKPWEPVVWEDITGWKYCAKMGRFQVTPSLSLTKVEWRCSFLFEPALFATKVNPQHGVKIHSMSDYGETPFHAVWNTINAFLQSMNENITHIARLYER